jgi:high affinity Mn2+ porin
MKSRINLRLKYRARLALPICLLIGYCSEISHIHAQTTGGSTPPADTKELAPLTASSSAPDHINLWNQDDAQNQNWMFHFQNTDIVQGYPGFTSPYEGQGSLSSDPNVRETVSIDAFVGAHLWLGGEIYADAEAYQGFGLANTHGIASFPNGEAFKTGETVGNVIFPRCFYRQTWGFGGEQEQLGSDELQLAQKVDVSRLTLQVGKFSFGDYFDNNNYSHDQRNQFMNWTLVDSAGFDSPQDADGYTNGIVLDFNQKNWALIWGHFMVTQTVNTHALDYNLTKAWEEVLELDERYSINDHPGTVRLLGFLLSANMGSYWDTVNDPNAGMDITQTAKYRLQYGFAISADQEITKDLGVFTRLSWAQPNSEAFMFTDFTQGLAVGGQLAGTAWSRPDDVVGLANTVGLLSQSQATYYNNGGQGMVIGDGHISYAPENVTELYYNAQLVKHVNLTGDFQLADNPGFNSDRGPVFIFGARLHIAY